MDSFYPAIMQIARENRPGTEMKLVPGRNPPSREMAHVNTLWKNKEKKGKR